MQQEEWTSIEHQIATELRRLPASPVTGCPEPEQLLDLIEAQESGKSVDARSMAHIATCADCRHAYVEMQQTWNETAALRQNQRSLAPQTESTVSTPIVTAVRLPETPQQPGFSLAKFWQTVFPPTVGFALGAAGVALVLLGHRTPSSPTTRPPISQQDTVALQQRDAKIAQLQKDAAQQSQHLKALQAAATEIKAQFVTQTRQNTDLQKRIVVARNDTRDSEQAARLLAEGASGVGRSLEGPFGTQEQGQTRGNGATETIPHPILLGTRAFAVRGGSRPILECKPLAGAKDYQIEVEPPSPDRSEVTTKNLSATRWQVTTPLHADPAKDRGYTWSVHAQQDGHLVTSQTGTFVVLSDASIRQLERDRQKLAGMPLALGVRYLQAGLLDEAEHQFKSLLHNDTKRPIAEALLKQLQRRRNGRL